MTVVTIAITVNIIIVVVGIVNEGRGDFYFSLLLSEHSFINVQQGTLKK